MKVNYEHTDTFGGEANYSWVKRGTIELPDNASDRTIVMKVKEELSMTGVPCKRQDYFTSSDVIELRPNRICQIIFITFGDN